MGGSKSKQINDCMLLPCCVVRKRLGLDNECVAVKSSLVQWEAPDCNFLRLRDKQCIMQEQPRMLLFALYGFCWV